MLLTPVTIMSSRVAFLCVVAVSVLRCFSIFLRLVCGQFRPLSPRCALTVWLLVSAVCSAHYSLSASFVAKLSPALSARVLCSQLPQRSDQQIMASLAAACVLLFALQLTFAVGQVRGDGSHPSSLAAAAAAAAAGSPPLGGSAGGSSYEDYSKTSRTYDSFRRPIGLDVIRDALEANAYVRQMDLKKSFKLLDAGCGSGSYLAELRDDVAEVHGLEFNEGMMMQAVGGKNLSVTQGSITEMPFKMASFDAVLTTQVLHHLEPKDCSDEERAEFKGICKACSEAYRVLKPGGAWIISTQTPAQHVDG